MNRYNRIMLHLNTDEQMKKHILSGIEKKLNNKSVKYKKNVYKFAGIGIVAAASIILYSTFMLGRLSDKSHMSEEAADESVALEVSKEDNEAGGLMSPDYTNEYDSFLELSAALGFDVPEIKADVIADFDVHFRLIDGSRAEIEYVSGDEIILYKVSRGAEDYKAAFDDLDLRAEYDFETEIYYKEIPVTYKIKGDKAVEAYWIYDGNSYLIESGSGISVDDMTDIISSIIK